MLQALQINICSKAEAVHSLGFFSLYCWDWLKKKKAALFLPFCIFLITFPSQCIVSDTCDSCFVGTYEQVSVSVKRSTGIFLACAL